MKILACDIGSTNLKLQVFEFKYDELQPHPTGEAEIITHNQNWLTTDLPLEKLSEWLTETADYIAQSYLDKVDAIGFSTYREGLIGLSPTYQIVFAGTNLQPTPLGTVEDASIITTFAGWMSGKLTGQYCITTGQKDAGRAYLTRVSQTTDLWAPLMEAGKGMRASDAAHVKVYLGGTDEQLGYVGTNLFDPSGPELVIATGTFWSTSRIAVGPSDPDVRRTKGDPPFLSVDSCVFYKWGPMIKMLADGNENSLEKDSVPTRYFGEASSFWFSQGKSSDETRLAIINDLRSARAICSTTKNVRSVVYGGGVRSQYARDLINEAFEDADVTFMDGDATLRGCAIIGAKFFRY